MNFNKYSKYNSGDNRQRGNDERRTSDRRQPQPFCPICKKNGRPESEYNSHFMRETSDENSRIICPILLNMECNHCGEKGHIVAKCPHKKCVFCNEFGHTVSRCTASSKEEIDRFLDERHNNYMNRGLREHGQREHGQREHGQREQEQRQLEQRQQQEQREYEQRQRQHEQREIKPIEDDFPSLSKKPTKAVEIKKGYSNIALIAAPLEAPKPVLKPVVKEVEEEYETDDDDIPDNDSIYSSKISDDDNW